jgi:[ribosomal protein S5]-alanine N-acetyltransferase
LEFDSAITFLISKEVLILNMLELNFTPFPVITTERLVLRSINENDMQAFYDLRSNEVAMTYIDRPRVNSIEDIKAMYNKIKLAELEMASIIWAITLKDKDHLIGTIGYYNISKENHRAEIGYMLLPQYFRQGIMQEAITELLKVGFHQFQFHSIEANINPANEASAKLLEKNNFVKEAYFKENFYFEGKFLDSIIYSKLASH